MSDHESKILGDFRIVREIGSGGQGTVYEARQMSLRDRRCALKVLTVGTGLSAQAVTRFEREAEIAARLDHPNIVPIYGRGEDGGRYYFAMKYVEGATLADVIERLRQQQEKASEKEQVDAVDEKLRRSETRTFVAADQERLQGIAGFLKEQQAGPSEAEDTGSRALLDQIAGWQMDDEYFRRVADVIAQVADGLDHAHREGVIHRDVKPGNIMVGRDGAPVITDFGVATELGGQTLTLTGDVFGTPHYMSPEQITVVKVGLDRRTDVYSLGVTLYELLTLRKPFEGDTREKVYRQILMKEPKPPRKVHVNVPRDLETIAQKAMEKDADQRYHSAADLADDLRRFLRNEPIWAKPPSLLDKAAKGLRRNKPAALGIAVGLFVLLTVGMASYLRVRAERGNVLREMYYANIALAEQKIRGGQIPDAERLLDACPEELRSWEWGHLKRLCHLESLTLRGHRWSVASVAFSPDGQRIASGSWDNNVKVWDAETGREVLTLRGHDRNIYSVVFSPNGQRIACSGLNGTVKVWDATSGREVLTLKAHRAPGGCSVAFSPDGQRIASGSDHNTLKVWEATSGRELFTLRGHGKEVASVAFSPDGRHIASGSRDNTVKVWDATSGRELFTLRAHRAPGRCSVAFSPDGGRIAFVVHGRTVKIHDAASGRELLTLRGHSDEVSSLAFSSDGQRLASGSVDSTVKVWDAASGDQVLTLRGPGSTVLSLAFSPDGLRIASYARDGTKIWHVASARRAATLRGHGSTVKCVAFSSDGQRIASGSADGTAKVWDVVRGREVVTLRGHGLWTFRPARGRALSGNEDGIVKVWDAEWDAKTDHEVLRANRHRVDVNSVAFSPDGEHVASASDDRTVRVWDATSGRELVTAKVHRSPVRSVAFSPDGQHLASGSVHGSVKVWDAVSGRDLFVLRGHGRPVLSLVFAPDGQRIVFVTGDGTVTVADAANGRRIVTHKGLGQQVRSVAFSPDGQRMAYSSMADNTVTICDAASGREVLTFRGDGSPIWCVAFSPDRQRIACPGLDGTVKLWDAASGREVLTLRGHGGGVYCVAFGPHGQRIVSGSMDNTVKVWGEAPALSPSEFLAGARRGRAKALHHLALFRERKHEDARARELHTKAAGAAGLAQKEWAERSRWRLEHLPWLQLWYQTYDRIRQRLESGAHEAGIREYRECDELTEEVRQRLTDDFIPRLLKLAYEHVQKEDLDGAIQHYRRVIELDPDCMPAHQNLASIRHRKGEHEEAVTHYRRRSSSAPPGDEVARRAIRSCAHLLAELGRNDDAIQELRKWVQKDTEDSAAHVELASLFCSLQQYREAGQALQPVLSSKGPSAKALLVAALCSQALGRNEEAGNYVRTAMRRSSPALWPLWPGLAIADLLERGIEVRRPLESLLRSDDALRVQFDACLALGYTMLASRLAGRGEKTEGAQACGTALRLAPDRAEVQGRAGYAYQRLGMYEDAVRCCSKATELEPNSVQSKRALADALNSHAWHLLTRDGATEGDAARALPMAEEAVDLSDRKNHYRLDTLALACFKTGNAVKAVKMQEEAIALLRGGENNRFHKEYSERLATFRAAARKLEPKR